LIRVSFLLLSSGLILGYATLRYGGVLPADWNPCALALGVVLVCGYLPIGRDYMAAPTDRLLYLMLLAIPCWALLQTVPMPLSWIAHLSPERAALARPLLRFDPNPVWVPLSIRPEVTLQYALRYLAFVATFLLTRDLMWRMPARQWIIALPPLTIASLEAVIGLLQNSSGVANVVVSGTFVNRDHFTAMLEMCLPFAAAAILAFAPRGMRALAACAGAVLAALLLAAISLSLSRGGFFIALGSLLLLACLHAVTRMRGARRIVTIGGSLLAVLCAAVVLASGGLLDRMATASYGNWPWDDRILFWRETVHVIAAYPVFGCGFGGFVSAVAPWRAAAITRTLDYAHNDYLQFLAEGGVIAFAMAAIVGFVVARSLWRGIFRQRSTNGRSSSVNRERRGIAIACGVALFAGMLHSGVDLITYVPATGMLLCWIAGMAAGLTFDEPAGS